jgi:ADP-dependent phosphofructokinase/glucokinase
MDTAELKKIWREKYTVVPQQVEKIREIKTAATAFNANIDAVLKMSAKRLAELIKAQNLTLEELNRIEHTKLLTPQDVLKGIFKCFVGGIAEEWLSEDKTVYEWMRQNLGYDRLQIGGQGGIVANALATAGVQNVFVHTNSLPALQATQFAQLDNLLSFDENGQIKPAYTIDRTADMPLIHWIIEFDRGDVLELEGQKFRCPKSNRFIATYDPLNLKLITDPHFMKYVRENPVEYVVLSGFHALTENNDGVNLIKNMAKDIKLWRQHSLNTILHLEIASTQDLAIRRAIIEEIAPLADSIGINEREAIDILEVIGKEKLASRCRRHTTSDNLFQALVALKEKTGVPRIQLHMFGLYLILQDRNFQIAPIDELNGMMTAATIAAAKAGTGTIDNLLWAQGRDVSDVGLIEAESLAVAAGQNDLVKTGIGRYRHWDLIIAPTILIEKPVTLVGMGDTISSLSLVAARP